MLLLHFSFLKTMDNVLLNFVFLTQCPDTEQLSNKWLLNEFQKDPALKQLFVYSRQVRG